MCILHFFFFFRPLSLIIGNASCFYSFFCIGGVRGQWTNHLIIKKCHFSAFQIRGKKKGEMGRGKRSTSWQFFFFFYLAFFYEQVAVFAFFLRKGLYILYIYINVFKAFFYFLVLCLSCSSPQVFFACLYRAALLLHACVL